MAFRNVLAGTAGANQITGSAAPDLIYGFDPNGPQAAVSGITATRVATDLDQPLFATAAPDDASRLFVVERGGTIRILDLENGGTVNTPFLDVTREISVGGERGLLGLAFHPDYATNGRFYVNLINREGDTEIRGYTVSATNPDRADPGSAALVLRVEQPEGLSNHKAGWLDFAPDGTLYAALGDGGVAANAQNADNLLGKILRLDVNADAFPADAARNYAIPANNPFAATAGADEIWALGLRNPWRASFDRGTGEMYIADVGQNEWEEIDIGQAGANYGWPAFEGTEAYQNVTPTIGTLTPPIYTYGHDVGRSITGGYVYRGPAEEMQGQYVFGDFISGRIWSLQSSGGTWSATERTAQIQTNAGRINQIASFGEDARGNLYVVDFDGDIFRLTPRGAAGAAGSGDGADVLRAGDGPDMVFAGDGADAVFGDLGDDELHGHDGDDTLDAGDGNDVVFGGAGNDLIIGDGGGDGGTGLALAGDYLLG
ncbi:PQQ-dependent sugar dehydrogenase [Azospirillum sp.]|uniref:PQQ-dependent sugar dehydrogenase n=1 Tax=Azospirillum sp. TaxID=34012 RepID=UPI002D474EA5|nr:PQQ-dependent sugar dehydrogenase [Azospirillum sp.]HYD66535.1 PQQ-dependent sugar dehydrogenase [Azospirillum sp.]